MARRTGSPGPARRYKIGLHSPWSTQFTFYISIFSSMAYSPTKLSSSGERPKAITLLVAARRPLHTCTIRGSMHAGLHAWIHLRRLATTSHAAIHDHGVLAHFCIQGPRWQYAIVHMSAELAGGFQRTETQSVPWWVRRMRLALSNSGAASRQLRRGTC